MLLHVFTQDVDFDGDVATALSVSESQGVQASVGSLGFVVDKCGNVFKCLKKGIEKNLKIVLGSVSQQKES